jgi:hypothetical protein
MKNLVFITALFLFLSVSFSHAALTFYTNRAAWETAVANPILTEDFDSIPPYLLQEGINSAGLIDIELINLVAPSIWNSINNGSGSQSVNGSPFYQGGSNANNSTGELSGADFIDLHLPYAVIAFGGDFCSTHSGDGLTLSVNGESYEFTDLLPGGVGSGFLGFISTVPFTTVRLYDAEKRETFGLDNVSFAVPEPGTLVLLAVGAISLLRKRR